MDLEEAPETTSAGQEGKEVSIIVILSISIILLYLIWHVFFHYGGLLIFALGIIAILLMEIELISWAYRKNLGTGTGDGKGLKVFPDTEYSRIVRRAGMALEGKEYSRELILKELWSVMIERASMKMSARQSDLRRLLESNAWSEFDDTEKSDILRKYYLMSKNGFSMQIASQSFQHDLLRFFDDVENY